MREHTIWILMIQAFKLMLFNIEHWSMLTYLGSQPRHYVKGINPALWQHWTPVYQYSSSKDGLWSSGLLLSIVFPMWLGSAVTSCWPLRQTPSPEDHWKTNRPDMEYACGVQGKHACSHTGTYWYMTWDPPEGKACPPSKSSTQCWQKVIVTKCNY